jgi:hypothetical protein
MLAGLTMGTWGVNRLHRPETLAENERHNTEDVARVYVRISKHPALGDLSKLHASARAHHNSLTLPSINDGMRLMAAGREMEHAAVMSKYADRHNEIVAAFLADYDNERAEAPARLNGLYVASKWPPHSVVAEKFKFRTQYLPMPTDGAWGDWVMEAARVAEDALRERIVAALKRVRDNCGGDGRLYVSVFDSIRDLVDMVPDMDWTDQFTPVVQAMAPLARMHAEDLRDDDEGRKLAAQKASSILSVLGNIS